MYKAIVFAGTTEGYEISRFLSENKVSCLCRDGIWIQIS